MPEPTLFVGGDPVPVPPNYPTSGFMDDAMGVEPPDPFAGVRDALVQATKHTYQKWDEARQGYLSDTDRVWKRYLNEWDWSGKKDWQSQKNIPKITMAVERLVATMSRLLTMSKKWFDVKALSPKKDPWINFVREWMEFQLSHPKVNFRKVLKQAIKVGLLANILAVLVTYETNGIVNPEHAAGGPAPEATADFVDQMSNTLFDAPAEDKSGEPSGFMRLEVLNPRKILLDPTGRKRGLIIVRHYTKAEFRYEAKERNWIDVEQVIESCAPRFDKLQKEATEKGVASPALQDDIEIWECFFDHLPDEKGEEAVPMRNFHFIMANEEFVVQEPIENPFWHGEIPVVVCGLLDVPFSVYHKSPVGISLEAIECWVEFLNMIIDHYRFVAAGVKEINVAALHPDESFENVRKVFPGRTYLKNGPDPVITPVEPGQLSAEMMPFMQLLGAEIGEGTAMRDAMEGPPRTRQKMSAMEYTSRIADAGVLLDSIFEHIQDDLLVPMLTMLYKNSLQFTPMDIWTEFIKNRQERFPLIAKELEALKGMGPEARFEMLASDLQFQTNVFSAIFDRQQEIESATFLAGIIGRIPMGMAHVQWGLYLRRIVENLGMDAEEIISLEPLVPYSELVGGKSPGGGPLGGSDGGEAIPSQPQGANQIQGQSGGSLMGGMGTANKEMTTLMGGGTAKPGSPM